MPKKKPVVDHLQDGIEITAAVYTIAKIVKSIIDLFRKGGKK